MSNRLFFRKLIVEDVLNLKSLQGIDLSKIIFEISEPTLINNTDNIICVLSELKSLGIKLSIDCYGAEYSSFRLISSLDIDYLKIDKSFIQERLDDSENEKNYSLNDYFCPSYVNYSGCCGY
ncbi:MAG: EAL domain-containing protein [Pseudomonadales bacterium]|nr:EAL domain-containing protein [Pseudomonadales bacterium]NRA15170.1 EAL domain-containing protein [Oceanospirillaceae bacterium]